MAKLLFYHDILCIHYILLTLNVVYTIYLCILYICIYIIRVRVRKNACFKCQFLAEKRKNSK